MAKRFEELDVWQKSRDLSALIYRLTKNPEFAKDFGLTDQIRRAAVSVMSNIAEGFERGSREELIYFLYIAKGSCGEVRSQLYVARDLAYIDENQLSTGLMLAETTSRMLYHFIESAKSSVYKGLKFKPVKDTTWNDLLREMKAKNPNLDIERFLDH